LLLIALGAFNAMVRWHCLSVPLDRDEGEFAYGGQLLLAGELPYRSFHAMKFPGIYLIYALMEQCGGQTIEAIHGGLLVVNTWNLGLVFLLGRRLMDDLGGLLAAACYAALCLSKTVEPAAAQAEHFVLMFALPGMLLMLRPAEGWQRWLLWLASGLCFGAALLMKQHAMLFGLVTAAYVLAGQWTARRVAWPAWFASWTSFLAGLAIPYLATAWFYSERGVFNDFWFWTVVYPREYITLLSPLRMLQNLYEQTLRQWMPVPLLGMASIAGLALVLQELKEHRERSWLIWFAAASALAIIPGGYFRSHYYLLVQPAVALFAGYSLWRLTGASRAAGGWDRLLASALVVGVVVGWSLFSQSKFLLSRSPDEISRGIYGPAFPEAKRIAEELIPALEPADRIAVLGSEPEIFFYTGHRSATGHIYMYPLMESHAFALTMQEQAIREIEEQSPRFIVFAQVPTSWLRTRKSHQLIDDWFERYIKDYKLVFLADIFAGGETAYVGLQDLERYRPLGDQWVAVYRRRDCRVQNKE
jgi:hypothetical protein